MAALVLAFLGVVYIPQFGVLKMMFGEETANALYPIMNSIIQILGYIAVSVIAGLVIWCIYSYVCNRGKPDETIQEETAINQLRQQMLDSHNALLSEIKELRKDLNNKGDDNGKSKDKTSK